MSSESGLRERKKAATRAALSSAAIRIAADRGLDAVTAEMIASEAGVSTRTFHNYFGSKEEAVVYEFERAAHAWVQALRERPADEPIWASLEHLAVAFVSDGDRSFTEMCAVAKLFEESPALLAQQLTMANNVTTALAAVIAERTGTDADRDLYPVLLESVIGAVVKNVMRLVVTGNNGDRTAPELVREAIALIRNGLTQEK